MTGKQEIIRSLENLTPDSLAEVKEFIACLKKGKKNGRRRFAKPELVAKTQFAAIKKWSGQKLPAGFSGRDHDRILYGAK
jgi:hypothetical protein